MEDGDYALSRGSFRLAFEIYMMLANSGEDPAVYKLSSMCQKKQLGPEELALLLEWLKEKIKGNYGPALFNLGFLYEKGSGFPQDTAKAIEYYERACQQELPEAFCNLGNLLLEPKINPGGIRSFENALGMLEKAASWGYMPAIYSVGGHYFKGDKSAKDINKAFRYFLLGAKLGHDECKKAIYLIQASRPHEKFEDEIEWANHQMAAIDMGQGHMRTR
jgi:TPR repeat protein